MPPSTRDPDTPAASTTERPTHVSISVFAVFVLVVTYIEVEATPAWYPTWLYLGEVTLPTGVLPPMLLGLAVLFSELRTVRDTAGFTRTGIIYGGLALLVEATGVLAIISLNQSPGGVFWAGLPPLLFGALLALVVLARELRYQYAPAAGHTD